MNKWGYVEADEATGKTYKKGVWAGGDIVTGDGERLRFDRAQVGQTAARIRSARPPEPYGGKGIRYKGERVREKAGKYTQALRWFGRALRRIEEHPEADELAEEAVTALREGGVGAPELEALSRYIVDRTR